LISPSNTPPFLCWILIILSRFKKPSIIQRPRSLNCPPKSRHEKKALL
jgi:hypothetical protein